MLPMNDLEGRSTVIDSEDTLLSRGLPLCSTSHHIHKTKSERRLCLREFFIEEDEENENGTDILFHPPPPVCGCHQNVETLSSKRKLEKLEKMWNAK